MAKMNCTHIKLSIDPEFGFQPPEIKVRDQTPGMLRSFNSGS
jgi:hypothetical protein